MEEDDMLWLILWVFFGIFVGNQITPFFVGLASGF
jgi:hypothetical protein